MFRKSSYTTTFGFEEDYVSWVVENGLEEERQSQGDSL